MIDSASDRSRDEQCIDDSTLAALEGIDLSPERRARVMRHVADCRRCRQLVADFVGTDSSDQTQASLGRGTQPKRNSEPIGHEEEPPTAFDEYQGLVLIGQGTMGRVYVAHDRQLDRPVAIKFLRSLRGDEQRHQRFLIEARAIARVRHPNVVQVYRISEHQGMPYLVSEYVDGQSLASVPTPMEWSEVRRVGLALSAALGAAHRQGVLHRDIKPANAMLTHDGEIKLLDFGLAKLLDSDDRRYSNHSPSDANLTATGAIIGTPRYLAPELWEGHVATPQSDVYALGAMLFELCAGRPLFLARTTEEQRHAAIHQATPSLELLRPDIDRQLAAVIQTCIAKNASERPANGEVLCTALRGAAPQSASRWGRLHSLRNVGSIAGIVTVLVGATWLARMFVQQRDGVKARPTNVARQSGPQTVSVFGIENKTGREELDWLDLAISETVRGELGLRADLRQVSAERIEDIRRTLSLTHVATLSMEQREQAQKAVGGGWLVTGRIEEQPKMPDRSAAQHASNDSLRILIDVWPPSPASPSNFVLLGHRNEALQIGRQITSRLLGHVLGQSDGRVVEPVDLQSSSISSITETPHVMELRYKGIGLRRSREYQRALLILAEAEQLAPRNPLVHLEIAQVYEATGEKLKELAAARKAYQFSDSLNFEEKKQVEAYYYYSSANYNRAANTYRNLLESYPHKIDYGYSMAYNLLEDNRATEALEALELMAKQYPYLLNEPYFYFLKGLSNKRAGNLDQALLDSTKSADEFRKQGSEYYYSLSMMHVASELNGKGNFNQALAIVNQLFPYFQKIDSKRNICGIHFMRGRLLTKLGQIESALNDYNAAISIAEELGTKHELFESLVLSADLSMRLVSVNDASRRIDRAFAIADQDPTLRAKIPSAQVMQSDIWLREGRIDALLKYSQARLIDTPVGQNHQLSHAWLISAAANVLRGDFEKAQSQLDAAQASISSADRSSQLWAVWLYWWIELELSVGGSAQAKADELVMIAEKLREPDLLAVAYAFRARTLWSDNHPQEALHALETAEAAAQQAMDVQARLHLALAVADMTPSTSAPIALQAPIAKLGRAVAEAEKCGYWFEACRLRLALARLLSASGLPIEAKRSLSRAKHIANARGYLKLAHSIVNLSKSSE